MLTVAPAETGIPGYAGTAQGPLRVASTTGATVAGHPAASQRPCSRYYGQRMATAQPQAYGKTAPYAGCGYTPQQLAPFLITMGWTRTWPPHPVMTT